MLQKITLSLAAALILHFVVSDIFQANGSRVDASNFQGRNAIYGTVTDESRRPVEGVYVELLDDVNSSIAQAKTDVTGRFTFNNLVDGRYTLRVKPFSTDYEEETRQVMLASISSVRAGSMGGRNSGATTEHADIVLKPNARAFHGPFSTGADVVFAQNIPPAAKKLYDEGIAFLRQKNEKEGFDSLKRAIETFPDYYLALDRLGAEYAVRGANNPPYLQAAYALLTRAVEINPRGFSSFYALGWSQFHLGLNAESIETLKRATSLFSKAADTLILLGKALRRASKFAEAEAAFKRANELANGKSPDVHWQLANLYNDQKRYNEAADEMELFLKTTPKNEETEKVKALIKQLRDKASAKVK